MRLLYRFYDPQFGSIYLGQRDIRDISIQSLRKNIAVVPQDCVLFNKSIYDNIAYGNIGSSLQEVSRAISVAGLHQSIESMPDKLNTQVGERGLKLSGEFVLYVG